MESDSSSVQWLSKAISNAAKSAKFCVAGTLQAINCGLEVEGIGVISFPLKPRFMTQLIAACAPAPYGKGTQTLLNKKVRNTLELDPAKFRLGDRWNDAIAEETRDIAEQLGLPADQLEARLYKLLVYEKGGFFLPHRDSEKHDRMVASLIVVLPHPFDGGALTVQHGVARQVLKFSEAAGGKAPSYAAFYADCEHEVSQVTRGVRLSLAYNLVLREKPAKTSASAKPSDAIERLAGSIATWTLKQRAKPLVFALEHQYTERGLSVDLLKGADRQLAELLVPAAEKAGCTVHLAQVSRHLMQFADDGSFERGYRSRGGSSRSKIEIGETYEDDLYAAEWTDTEGKKQPWGAIAFDLTAVISSTPIDKWTPTSEEFEGYTGNAGNTLDRWYHRSAIVVWHREDQFEVIASSGAYDSIPLFCSMVSKLSKTPKKRLEESRSACVRFAQAIIDRWPRQNSVARRHSAQGDSKLDSFPVALLKLADRDTISRFLSKLAAEDSALPLSSFVVDACREFGWNAFAPELKRLMSGESRAGEVPAFRDIEWLEAFCCDTTKDPDKPPLARALCAVAARRFSKPPPPRYSHHRRELSVEEQSLPHLLKALAASGCDQELSQVIRFVQASPQAFDTDACQIPCLNKLIPWAGKQFGQTPAPLAAWLTGTRSQLEEATARKPAPPTDWVRPAEVKCSCEYCVQLNTFLADPASDVGRIPAREDRRVHLLGMIRTHQCDVSDTLDRSRSPFSLVLKKTNESHKRAVARFNKNLKLLASLPKDG